MTQMFDISLNDIYEAQKQVSSQVRITPLEESKYLSRLSSSPIFLKLENWQKTGSFKIRGAFNKLLSLTPQEKKRGIITASAGNHGLGVAFAAKLLGISGKLVVPEKASSTKIKALQDYDLDIIQKGKDYDEAEALAWEIQKEEGLIFIHAFSDPKIIAGQGTIGLEIFDQLSDVDAIFVPIGGGGLISGVAVAAKDLNPKVRVFGVQSEASPAMYNSFKAGKIVETPIAYTIADGLAGRFVTEATLRLAQRFVDDVILVSENGIRRALKLILETEHMLIEGSAAVGVAVLLENKIYVRGRSVIILTGRNVNWQIIKSL